jgi:hypothetical protein
MSPVYAFPIMTWPAMRIHVWPTIAEAVLLLGRLVSLLQPWMVMITYESPSIAYHHGN